ncbi:MAG: hypothetical protein LUC91_00245 [Prevotella sp.]|nr:hypothetical protein [Prevotella sp.]
MRNKAIPFKAAYQIVDGKMMVWFNADADSCFGAYPAQDIYIKDIDVAQLFTVLGIKEESNLKYSLDRLPKAENDILRLKNFCDKNDQISIYHR